MPENETTREEGRRLTESHNEEPPALPPPPDGGYGWVIVLASFMCNMVVDGIGYSFSVLLDKLVVYFETGQGTVAWVGSIMAGTLLVVGPIVSALCNKFGCRAVCIAGAVVGCAGFVLSTFSTSVPVMMLTYGVLGGFGAGMIYLPSIVAVGYYFDTKRSLATGIAVCGSGVGTVAFPPLTTYLLATLGTWQKANLVIAGIVLFCCVLGFLMKPLTYPDEPSDKLLDQGGEKAKKLESIDENLDMKSQGENGTVRALRISRNVSTPAFSSGVAGLPKRGSVPSLHRKQSYGDNLQKPDLLLHGSDPSLYKHCKQSIEFGAVYNSKLSVARDPPKIVRPLSRKDIFYSGSVLNLPQYQSQKSLQAFRKSMVSLPQSVADVERQSADKCCGCLPGSFKSALSSMMDMSLLKDLSFMLIGVSNFFAMAGLYVPFVYIKQAAINDDVPLDKAVFLISVIGITNTVCRIVCGYIADFPWMDSLHLNNLCLAIATLSVGLTPLCASYSSYVAIAIVFGIGTAGFISLTSIILVDILGLDKLTNAFGLLILFRGVATIIGSPIAGALIDAMGNKTDAAFYMGGAFFLLATISSVAVGFLRKKPAIAQPAGDTLAPIDEDQEEGEVGDQLPQKQSVM